MNWKKIAKFIDTKLEERLLIILFIVMTLLVFLQVITRYFFNLSVGWSSELSRYILIWITWISSSYVIRLREHIRLTFISSKLHPAIQKGIEVLVNIFWLVFAFVLAIVGTEVAMKIKMMGQTTADLQFPMWIVYAVIPISGFLMIIRACQQLYFIFQGDTNEGSDHT